MQTDAHLENAKYRPKLQKVTEYKYFLTK